ncbi:hypothetical protein ACLQ29_30125 [Micromonospora sp. DT228]|uniref:hypothetical protein n=1 Tax=Micromonospora sp. DT228 TaxID=3393443 RepID=UPI003CE68B96
MTTDEDRDRLAEQLVGLPVYELVDVMRRVLPHYTDERYGCQERLILATSYRCDEAPDTVLSLVAWPDRDYYDGGLGPDQGLWEGGPCSTCEIDVSSNAKRGYCPACDTRLGMT